MSKRPNFGRPVECKDSSVLELVYYDPDTMILDVVFRSGDRYRYEDVPHEIVTRVIFGRSRGGKFTDLIKTGGYEFRKMRKSTPRR